ncbi:MAG TPA: alpha/beta fold hydrolase [Candidatus Acidoferrales bacterium]|nr:alpha/beta fold hydrolase [Candidatus Acidoferrales bacterium]
MDPAAGCTGYTNALQELSKIWEDVLGKTPESAADDFFRAGGNPSLTIRLFDEIRVRCGRSIPPLAIYNAPTISALAHLLVGDQPAQFSNALLLESGPARPPLFLLHGLGGHVMEFFELLGGTIWPCPVYGLQARGTDGLQAPLDRIESMADYHFEAITRIQPEGPYFICGYSLGGLVGVEIALRLLESGRAVGSLLMIDSYPHAGFLPPMERFRLNLQRARHRITRAGSQRHKELQVANERMSGPALTIVEENARRALQAYRPRAYSGKVVFFRAQITTVFPADPRSAWQPWIPALEIETVAGDHHSILREDAQPLGSALSRRLNAALP